MVQGAGGRSALVWLSVLVAVMLATSGCSHVGRKIASLGMSQEISGQVADAVCERLSGMDHDHCFQQIAKVSSNPLLCEKIDHPGPKSKCTIFVEELMEERERPWIVQPGQRCYLLQTKSSGDGAYTMGDCFQYLAVAWQDPLLCDNLLKNDLKGGSNDLNKQGVSYDTCVRLAGARCGHIGQPACLDRNLQNQKYCLEGQMDRGNCVPEV